MPLADSMGSMAAPRESQTPSALIRKDLGNDQRRRRCSFRTPDSTPRLGLAFGFAQARDAVAFFPLTAFFQQLNALKAFEHVAFPSQSGRCAKTSML